MKIWFVEVVEGRKFKSKFPVIVMLWFISQRCSQTQFNQCILNQRLDIQRVIDGLVKVFISGKNYYKCKELPILKRGHCYSFQCKFWNSFHFRKKKYAWKFDLFNISDFIIWWYIVKWYDEYLIQLNWLSRLFICIHCFVCSLS